MTHSEGKRGLSKREVTKISKRKILGSSPMDGLSGALEPNPLGVY
jgi:hypothetical protein